MRITSLSITNFRGCKSLVVPVVNGSLMLLGMNGAGKTSTLMALQWAMTGTCYDKLGKAEKLAELVGPHGKNAKVVVSVEHEGVEYKLDCTTNTKASQIILTYGEERVVGADARKKMFALCGFDMTHAHASSHPHAYVLSDDIYVRLAELGGGLEMDALATYCADKWPWFTAWLKEQSIKLERVEDLRRAGDHAYTERTAVNNDIKRIKLRLEELVGYESLNPDDLDRATALLDSLKKQRDGLLQTQAKASTARSEADILADIREAEAKLFESATPPDLGGLESDIETAMRRHSTLQQETHSLGLSISMMNKELAAAKGNCCPTCKRAYDVPVDEQAINEKLAAIQQAQETITEKNAEAATVLNTIAAKREELAQARKVHSTIIADRSKLSSRIEALRSEKPATPFDQEALTTIETRIARGEKLLADLRLAKERKQLIEARTAATHRADMLTWVVEQFRDGNAQSALGANAQQQFLAVVNDRLQSHGYRLNLKQEGSALVAELWREGREAGASIFKVSDGELLIVQSVIAEALGCGFAIVDRVGDLDDGNRSAWFARINDEVQYIFAATWVKPGVPNVAQLSAGLGCTVAWIDRDVKEEAA